MSGHFFFKSSEKSTDERRRLARRARYWANRDRILSQRKPVNVAGQWPDKWGATLEYRIWRGMKTRCYNKKSNCAQHYYERGITVCDEWKNSFATFIKDMGLAPSRRSSIDRKDNNLGYAKENCRWGTTRSQARNRAGIKLTYELAEEIRRVYAGGDTTHRHLAARFGVCSANISLIVNRKRWDKA